MHCYSFLLKPLKNSLKGQKNTVKEVVEWAKWIDASAVRNDDEAIGTCSRVNSYSVL